MMVHEFLVYASIPWRMRRPQYEVGLQLIVLHDRGITKCKLSLLESVHMTYVLMSIWFIQLGLRNVIWVIVDHHL